MDNSVRYYAIYYIQKVPSWWNPKNECVLHHYSVGTEAEIKAEVEKLNAEKPAYWERNKCKELIDWDNIEYFSYILQDPYDFP